MSTRKLIGLVASVESQPSVPSPAIDLYRSAEFLAARRRAEKACERWFILSPHHGLVSPGDWLTPYRETLREATPKQRREWSERIFSELGEKLGSLTGLTFEIHAGSEFYEDGLKAALEEAGAKVRIGAPAQGEAPKPTSKRSPVGKGGVSGLFAAGEPARPTGASRAVSPVVSQVEVSAAERRETLNEFYALLDEQGDRIGGRWTLPDCSGDDYWPDHGVVFFFESGEMREKGEEPRVVRVGTHALTAKSKTRLWDRLRSDRGTMGGSNPGAGNHRASAFRRHVGRALIARDGFAAAAASWGIAGNISPEMKERELPLEREVSRHLAEMSFIWLGVPELEDRRAIEQGSIALLSNLARDPVDPPGANWLGLYGGDVIADAGIWNLDHAEKPPEPGLLDLLRRHLVE